MSTSLENSMILLSKELGDYWASTTTSSGSSTTIVDTALQAKASDWITDDTYDRITSGTYDEEERKVSSLSTSTLTTLAHGGTIASDVTYELHRLGFNASDKAQALIHGAKAGFPYIFKEIRDETKTLGNWARNGCFTEWASADYPDYWRVSTITAAEETDLLYVKRGDTCCKLTRSGSDGYLYTSEDYVYNLKELANKSVTFSAYVFADAADQVRLAIYDGTTTTYSDHNSVTSIFEELEVTATIKEYPTAIEFRIYVEADSDVYISDARVVDPTGRKIYIGDLGLAQNKPHQILRERANYSQREPWILLHNYEIGSDGYAYFPTALRDYRLRILGVGYLDFLKDGAVSTAWDSEIALDSPQTEILIAEAAIYLCNQMIVPNQTSGTSERWKEALGYWGAQLRDRQGKYGMMAPGATVHWR